jgi:glyoxylase-like metal-dependent hydrolase (beta-lactamase superfamily II)
LNPRAIDLVHDGLRGAISAYLVLDPVPTVVDPGPTPSLENLEKGLAEHGVSIRDLRRLLLTHVHLDHAGGTGDLVAENPELAVHVHVEGAPHLADPERLVKSTRRTFGEAHDRLWGVVRPVPAANLRPWDPSDPVAIPGFRVLPTPGHIAHHLAYLHEGSGTLLSGDALGVILADGAPTHPPTPPPSFDWQAWERTLTMLATFDCERIAVAHFGLHPRPRERARELIHTMRSAVERVEGALDRSVEDDRARYERDVRSRLSPSVGQEQVDRYFDVFAAAADWDGIRFYLERNRRR